MSSRRHGTFAPLSVPIFRNIWLASLAFSTGALIQSVGSAWMMQEMAPIAMVALVQTATFLPIALFAIPAGAIADMYDRRKTQMVAAFVSLCGASAMTAVAALGLLTPWSLLAFCFTIGSGTALFAAAWQSSAGEQVPAELLPQALALNGISYNIARSVGPALGGVIVATVGATAAFLANAIFYLPMLAALLGWKRQVEPARLPPEKLDRAIVSGVRYIFHMPPVRTAVIRSFVSGLLGACFLSLMPLIARDLLGGGASLYGILLACFGIGAVAGVFVIQQVRSRGSEQAMRLCSVVLGGAVLVLALSRHLALTAAALVVAGCAWMILITSVSIVLQLFVPRWVSGRAVAALQALTSFGIAFGSWIWGGVAEAHGVSTALLVGAVLIALSWLLGLVMPLADRERSAESMREAPADPEVKLAIIGRSGPIAVELEYRIPAEAARDFYNAMQDVQHIRVRNGAYDWTLSRDLSDPETWSERFRCPTWHDYLRQRSRRTIEEIAVERAAIEMVSGAELIRVRRWLERPFGSVRWRPDSPDRGEPTLI